MTQSKYPDCSCDPGPVTHNKQVKVLQDKHQGSMESI